MRQRIAEGAVCSRNVAIYITRDYMVSRTKNSESIMLKHIPEAVGFGNPPKKMAQSRYRGFAPSNERRGQGQRRSR